MIHGIIEFAVRNKVTVILLLAALLTAGYFAAVSMPADVYPDLNAPVVTVVTENPGMAPEDVETLLTFPLESALNSLPHVTRVSSSSSLGISLINVEFEYGADIYFARQLVSEKLQLAAPGLPDDTIPPFIGPVSSMFADAIEFTIKGDDLFVVRDFAEWVLKPRLQTASGVSNVINFGGFLKQYQVVLDPGALFAHGLTAGDVVRAIAANNRNSSGGYLLEGPQEKIIRGVGRIQTIADIEHIILAEYDGVPVYVSNVADVRIGGAIRRGSAGENGEEVVAVTVQNQYRANVMRTIEGVERILGDVRGEVAGTMTIEPFYTQLDMITKSFGNMLSSMMIGGVFVVLILFLFLNNVRTAFLVSLSIPLSLVVAILFMKAFGLTFNIMTLGGLAIGLGMIVDSSIIMAENIYRHIHDRVDRSTGEAVLNGALEVGRPIFFATLILLAVFAPIFTLQGIEGRMFIPLAFAVSAAVFGSLVVSLTIIPVFSGFLLGSPKKTSGEGLILPLVRRLYNRIAAVAIDHAGVVAIVCLMLVVMGTVMFFRIGSEFMPEMDESSLVMDILLPPDTSLDESGRVASLISQRVSGLPGVVRVVRRTGRAEGAEHAEPVNLTEANIVLVPREERNLSITEIKDSIRDAVVDIPGVSILLNAPLQHRINHVATGTKAAIAVKIFGDNINTLIQLGDQVNDAMSTVEGVTDLRMEQVSGVPQLQIRIDREKIARYGLNVEDVSELIETALKGVTATEVIETRKRYDVFVRYGEEYRKDTTHIRDLLVQTPSGGIVPLSELAEITETRNPSIIRRENALRRTMIQCNVSGRDMGGVVDEIRAKVGGITLPEGYFVTYGGAYENQIRAMKQLAVTVVITIAVVFILLVMSFHSVRQGLLILLNIPLALVGGVTILYMTGATLSVPSIVGFIALIGIAVQDGIVLVTHINKYRANGMELTDALMQAGNNKLRPVLMTTFTTMLGLVPLAVRNVTGSEIQKPLALVVMFGLLFSTVITLVVLPAFYKLTEGRTTR